MSGYKRKLIEVALPLDAINREATKEKGNPFLSGHPRNLHQWWARRPLVVCRTILFASLVDDPSSLPQKFPTIEQQTTERERLFSIVERLASWESSNDRQLLDEARKEIVSSCDGVIPAIFDPFSGSGSIPIEAKRLGCEAYGGDLNPVAVLISKGLLDIPTRFYDRKAINPKEAESLARNSQTGVEGLCKDILYYASKVHSEASRSLSAYYPDIAVPEAQGGGRAKVLGWIWARTVCCPNPACKIQMPLIRSYWLSSKKGKEVYLNPVVKRASGSAKISFEICTGKPKSSAGTMTRRGAICINCQSAVPFDHIRSEGKAGRINHQLLCVVADTRRGRAYCPSVQEHEQCAANITKPSFGEHDLSTNSRHVAPPGYGMYQQRDLYTNRQLFALCTFSDHIKQNWNDVYADAISAGFEEGVSLEHGGTGARAYADAITTYLAFVLDKIADYGNALCMWNPTNVNVGHLFTKQVISMAWDFVEANPLYGGLAFENVTKGVVESIAKGIPHEGSGHALMVDAMEASQKLAPSVVISTDPPYYDNVPYADLSDFFYIWLKRTLNKVYPDLFNTVLVPKSSELVADNLRQGSKEKAQEFFESGLERAFSMMYKTHDERFPLTVYYAFKQSEQDEPDDDEVDHPGMASTGWETMLGALIKSGFAINGTWPVRTERSARSRGQGSNALASSIVLVCRPRPQNAPICSRRDFVTALKKDLTQSLDTLMAGGMAPVDLAQASIGPGMAVFSRYSRVLDFDGSTMSVRGALKVINQELEEYLSAQEGELDSETQVCVSWFQQKGLEEGLFGDADVLARAKNTSVESLVDAGVVFSRAGKVRLLKRAEYPNDWDPQNDKHLIVWECTQHLINHLLSTGEDGAASLINKLGPVLSEQARSLAYRLYAICDRNNWTDEGFCYNTLVVAWPSLMERAANLAAPVQQAITL